MTCTTLWTRKFALAAAAGVLVSLLGTGCAVRQDTVAFDTKAPEPGIDQAIVERHFQSSVASYTNTVVVAGSTRFPLVDAPDITDPERYVAEPAIFLINVGMFPVAVIAAPPFVDQKGWRVCGIGPTFSGNPSLDDPEPLGGRKARPENFPNDVPKVGP